MKRNAYFDNAKLWLIVLVVFGHMIQPFVGESKQIETMYTWIYLFHMPAFIFLAGFFARGNSTLTYIKKLAKNLLVPYIIFQTMYTAYYYFIGRENWLTDHLFYPHWSLWFLISLFSWHMLLIAFRKLSPFVGVFLSVLLGIAVGYVEQIDHAFSLSRTIVFFPYFLIGYWVSVSQLNMLKKKTVQLGAVVVLFVAGVTVYLLPTIDVGWFLNSKPYSALGAETMGGFMRLVVYFTATIMAVAILSLIPRKRFSFTVYGERTLYVYLLHGFIVQYIRVHELIRMENVLDLLVIGLLSIGIVWILSTNFVVKITQPIVELQVEKLGVWWKNKSKQMQQKVNS